LSQRAWTITFIISAFSLHTGVNHCTITDLMFMVRSLFVLCFVVLNNPSLLAITGGLWRRNIGWRMGNGIAAGIFSLKNKWKSNLTALLGRCCTADVMQSSTQLPANSILLLPADFAKWTK